MKSAQSNYEELGRCHGRWSLLLNLKSFTHFSRVCIVGLEQVSTDSISSIQIFSLEQLEKYVHAAFY